jgi:hypothetical protein
VDADHVMLAKRFEKEMNFQLRDVLERQPTKKKPNVSSFEISEFFNANNIFKKDVVQQKQF